MSKGAETRTQILEHATALASQVGLNGLSIGVLANNLGLSKSGLFRHFESKEGLEIAVLEHAGGVFIETVIRPALKAPRGEPRLRELFERWLAWDGEAVLPGGCIFVTAAAELDDRPGPVRDRLVGLQRDWLELLGETFRRAASTEGYSGDVSPAQFAQELYGIMLAAHHHARLMSDPAATDRARRAFNRLLGAARAAPELHSGR